MKDFILNANAPNGELHTKWENYKKNKASINVAEINNKIDLSHLNNGVYQILIETETKQYIHKIIIQK